MKIVQMMKMKMTNIVKNQINYTDYRAKPFKSIYVFDDISWI